MGQYNQPLFEHDCDTCIFLGIYNNHDLYYHPGILSTIIARFSSDGPDYISGIVFARHNEILAEAKWRAIKMGLI
jgi:hypothetical protein